MAEKKKYFKLPETDDGTTVFKVPFPENLEHLKEMSPIYIKQPYQIDYLHSYGQDSPFFAGLTAGKLLSTKCPKCGYSYGTPRLHCMYCGTECDWVELPREGYVHCFTVCHFGSEAFLPETPFILIMVEWPDVDTLFLARLVDVDPADASLDWIGMKIRAQFRRNCKLNPTDVYFVPA
ncbi:nucleotide-binding protein [candidate division LCP-89 bacterium B3_LCP]|uniref:Nucleotide-binding protein n=1 Tax=candidate division LCP-89 bacterium B3_LCP TaxID=2012998 RepID=A0A532V2Y9_UNCL8|nr:MAG: nucleotide-binding protein [candidate division LCP-89 bacterium B3_LCP]